MSLSEDHLSAIRTAVAATYRADGLEFFARLVESGVLDEGGRMKAAKAAVEKVLEGLFS